MKERTRRAIERVLTVRATVARRNLARVASETGQVNQRLTRVELERRQVLTEYGTGGTGVDPRMQDHALKYAGSLQKQAVTCRDDLERRELEARAIRKDFLTTRAKSSALEGQSPPHRRCKS